MVSVPEGFEDLLDRPLFGHLATTRPDGTAQVNPMWFDWDGSRLRFTHTTKRQKYRNVTANPGVAMSIHDPASTKTSCAEIDGNVARTGRGPTLTSFSR